VVLPLLFSFHPPIGAFHSGNTRPPLKHHKCQELPLRMSSGHLAPHLEVSINKCQLESLNIIAVDACINEPPPTEAYRSQQFIDISDDLEGPPPYQDNVADTFIVVRDIHHHLSSGTTTKIGLSDRFLHVEADQYTSVGDFILFQDKVSWADSVGDINSSETSSSEVSCSSAISVNSSIESPSTSSASGIGEQQRSALLKSSHSATNKAHDIQKPVDMSRLVEWLQNVLPPAKEVAPSS
jgi:hypothetical protein